MSERKFVDSLKAAGKSLGTKARDFAGEIRNDEALKEVFDQAKEKIKGAASKEEINKIASDAQAKAREMAPDGASERIQEMVNRLRGDAKPKPESTPDIIDGEVIRVEESREK